MNNDVKIAVIGAGNWGKNHVRTLYDLGVLQCVVDKNEALLRSVFAEYPGVMISSEIADALSDPHIAGVVVATPAQTHYEISMQVLQSGKAVLIEKPMTLSVEEAQNLVSYAENNNRILMVGHLLLYRPSIQLLCEIIRSGRIGKIYKIEMRRRKLGKVRTHENVIWSFGPHDVAVLLSMVQSNVADIWAVGNAFLQKGIEDEASVHLSFVDGTKAELHFSWLWPLDERKYIIVGSEGMITYDEIEDSIWVHDKKVKADLTVHIAASERILVNAANALRNQDLEFLNCIQLSLQPKTNGAQGIMVIHCLTEAMKNIGRGAV